jgi:hypothetical protein
MFTCLIHFIVICKTINGALLHQFSLPEIAIPFIFYPLLSLFGYLFIFGKLYRCGSWRIHVFRFPLSFISPTQLATSSFHIEQNFWIASSRIGGFPDRWVQHFISIVPSPANSTWTSEIYKLAKKISFILFLALFLGR